MHPSLLAVFLALASSAEPAQDGSTDWPQWRGVDGMAVTSDTGLPTRLAPDADTLLWNVPVVGEGISSPVVSAGRVFLTSAYPGEIASETALITNAIPVLSGVLLVLCLIGLKGAKTRDEARGLGKLLVVLDTAFVSLGTLVFAGAALVATYRSELLWESGSPGDTWVLTGMIAMLGGALAAGWFRSSPLRVVFALVLVGCAIPLFQNVPPNKYAEPFRIEIKAAMVAPAIVGALWNVLVFLVGRRAAAKRSRGIEAIAFACLVFVSGSVFALQNVLKPAQGLVRAALCFDFETGQELWRTQLYVAPEEKKYPKNSYATPTPCADGERVFVHFGGGWACLDYDGNVLWSGVNDEYVEQTRYGAASSPILFEDTFVYLHDKEIGLGKSYVVAWDKETGEERWRQEPWKNHDSYTTPLVVDRGNDPQLVTVTFEELLSYDARTGEPLWSMPVPIEQMVPSLQHRGDLLLVSGGTHNNTRTLGFRMTGKGKNTQLEQLWSSGRAVPGIASPVLVDDVFVTVDDGGIMVCYDPESGEIHWRERMNGAHWASLVAGESKIYAVNDEGKLSTVRASPEFEVIAEGEFEESCYATPAIAQGRILVRTQSRLYCFGD